jgi:hypothetical protein
MMARTESRARPLLGFFFGAALASATVAAVAARLPLPETWSAAVAIVGSAIGAAFSTLIGAYGLSWRSAGLGVASGTAVGILPQPTLSGWSLVAGCWVSAAVASWAVRRERPEAVQMATPPGLVAAIHVLQLPLIAFSLTVSLVSPRPRPFVVMFSVSAFALWRLLDGECPLARAEEELRRRRGEKVLLLGEIGFIAHHIHRTTGLLIPKGSVFVVAYAIAAMAFTWYAVQALLGTN